MAKNCENSFRNERLVPPRFLKLLQDIVRSTLFEHKAYSMTGIYPDNLLFCFRLYKSREVLQNTVTYSILCKLQLLEGKLVLKSWNNKRRNLTIVLNMLIMAKYFVGLK